MSNVVQLDNNNNDSNTDEQQVVHSRVGLVGWMTVDPNEIFEQDVDYTVSIPYDCDKMTVECKPALLDDINKLRTLIRKAIEGDYAYARFEITKDTPARAEVLVYLLSKDCIMPTEEFNKLHGNINEH